MAHVSALSTQTGSPLLWERVPGESGSSPAFCGKWKQKVIFPVQKCGIPRNSKPDRSVTELLEGVECCGRLQGGKGSKRTVTFEFSSARCKAFQHMSMGRGGDRGDSEGMLQNDSCPRGGRLPGGHWCSQGLTGHNGEG